MFSEGEASSQEAHGRLCGEAEGLLSEDEGAFFSTTKMRWEVHMVEESAWGVAPKCSVLSLHLGVHRY